MLSLAKHFVEMNVKVQFELEFKWQYEKGEKSLKII